MGDASERADLRASRAPPGAWRRRVRRPRRAAQPARARVQEHRESRLAYQHSTQETCKTQVQTGPHHWPLLQVSSVGMRGLGLDEGGVEWNEAMSV